MESWLDLLKSTRAKLELQYSSSFLPVPDSGCVRAGLIQNYEFRFRCDSFFLANFVCGGWAWLESLYGPCEPTTKFKCVVICRVSREIGGCAKRQFFGLSPKKFKCISDSSQEGHLLIWGNLRPFPAKNGCQILKFKFPAKDTSISHVIFCQLARQDAVPEFKNWRAAANDAVTNFSFSFLGWWQLRQRGP